MAVTYGPRMAVQVNVPRAVMIVLMHVPSFLDQLRAQQAAKNDKHDAYGKFSGPRDRFRNRHVENEHDGSDE